MPVITTIIQTTDAFTTQKEYTREIRDTISVEYSGSSSGSGAGFEITTEVDFTTDLATGSGFDTSFTETTIISAMDTSETTTLVENTAPEVTETSELDHETTTRTTMSDRPTSYDFETSFAAEESGSSETPSDITSEITFTEEESSSPYFACL